MAASVQGKRARCQDKQAAGNYRTEVTNCDLAVGDAPSAFIAEKTAEVLGRAKRESG